MSEEEKNLLIGEDEISQILMPGNYHRAKRMLRSFLQRTQTSDNTLDHSIKAWVFLAYLAIVHAICILLGASFLWKRLQSVDRPDLKLLDYDDRYHWVPVEYELRAEYGLENPESEFTGLPTDLNTKAWDDLITPTYFSASREDLTRTNESIDDSVPLLGGGYLAGLGVYHDIHCLRRLRLFVHSNYYYENLTEKNMIYLREHMGHCIESLRRSVMCHADTNIFTFTWKDAKDVRPGIRRPNPKSNQERKCIKWEALEEWVLKRHVPLQPILLMPSGEKERILM